MLAITPTPQDAAWLPKADWLKRHGGFLARCAAGPVDLLFLGDSITESWATVGRATWDREYAPRRAANFGIGGDETQHVLWRLDHGEIDGLSPRVIVLLIGSNNLGNSGQSPQQTAAGIAAVVARLRGKLPDTPVLLLAVLPREREPDAPLRRAVSEVNAMIAPLADGLHVHWLDMGAGLLGADGRITAATMPDALHLSPAAYATWADTMRPMLDSILTR